MFDLLKESRSHGKYPEDIIGVTGDGKEWRLDNMFTFPELYEPDDIESFKYIFCRTRKDAKTDDRKKKTTRPAFPSRGDRKKQGVKEKEKEGQETPWQRFLAGNL